MPQINQNPCKHTNIQHTIDSRGRTIFQCPDCNEVLHSEDVLIAILQLIQEIKTKQSELLYQKHKAPVVNTNPEVDKIVYTYHNESSNDYHKDEFMTVHENYNEVYVCPYCQLKATKGHMSCCEIRSLSQRRQQGIYHPK